MLTAVGTTMTGYGKGFAGFDAKVSSEAVKDINPFTDLNADRLMLFGRGHWDVTSLLSDELVMPYREPRSLLAGLELGPHPAMRDSQQEVAKLARLWDRQGLLALHQDHRAIGSLVKVFNVKKNSTMDRQIGDRRGQNSYECRVRGPSINLPAGSDIMDLKLDVRTQKIVLMISDRKDYYHQIWTSDARTSTNAVGPPVKIKDMEGTDAYGVFLRHQALSKKRSRDVRGDDLHLFGRWHPGEEAQHEALEDDEAWACFRSFLQGDHAGVEIATDAHQNWLMKYGLLSNSTRLVASRSLRSPSHLEGLVIDDYFSASVEPRGSRNEDSRAAECYRKCSQVYADANLLGSPEKDVIAENAGKLIGAFVNSTEECLSRGLCTVGVSPEKRIAMSFLTLAAAQLSATTDVLHLCLLGIWSSILAYRRPMTSLMAKVFKLVDQNDVDHNNPKIIPLSRQVANELTLLATLAPLMISDLGAGYAEEVFSTDASSRKGAICSAKLGEDVMQALWRTCRTKGSYTRLLTPAQQILRLNEAWEEEFIVPEQQVSPSRPWACSFDFLEVFSGASLVTAAVAKYGVTVGPPLDLGISAEYDLKRVHVVEWISFMLAEKRLKAVMCSPPCTTFSIMRRPRLRSAEQPYGFDPIEEKTQTGNVLGKRAGQIARVSAVNATAALMETPYSAYLKFLPCWRTTKDLSCSQEVRSDSCRFGSPHLKSFRFLSVNMDISDLSMRCQCQESHVKVEGGFTKASATYVPKLVEAIAKCFVVAIHNVRRRRSEELSLQVDGLENQLVNEVSLSSEWKVVSSWTFIRKRSTSTCWRRVASFI